MDTSLENDEMKVEFDETTLFPKQIFFKRFNETVNLKVSLVRYPTANSDTGAYISAPRKPAKPV